MQLSDFKYLIKWHNLDTGKDGFTSYMGERIVYADKDGANNHINKLVNKYPNMTFEIVNYADYPKTK